MTNFVTTEAMAKRYGLSLATFRTHYLIEPDFPKSDIAQVGTSWIWTEAAIAQADKWMLARAKRRPDRRGRRSSWLKAVERYVAEREGKRAKSAA